MRREFINKLNKFTSLLMATVLILCSFEGAFFVASAEPADVSGALYSNDEKTVDISENYIEPQAQNAPDTDMTIGSDENAEMSDTYTIDENIGESIYEIQGSETAVSYVEGNNNGADSEENTSGSAISMQSERAPIELYSSAYTLTADDLDYYDNDPAALSYTINNVDDWLKVEALSKVRNFEGREINVQTPEDERLQGKYYLAGTGFTGLGSDTYPFCGTLRTNMGGVSVNCDCPLVSYMSSKATIEQFVIGISGGNAGIAGTLIFEGDEPSTMLLKGITVTGYLESTTADGVGGLFGTVINTTEHRFTIDAAKVSQSEADNWGGINMEFDEHDGKEAIYGKNVGTFIGKIVGNVTLTVNKDFHISAPKGTNDSSGNTALPSLYGTESTGSVVGRMEYYEEPLSASMKQSQLSAAVGYSANPDTYPMIHFKEWSGFSVDNIKGIGYNGGIVGYTDHAKIFNDTENAVLEITNSSLEGAKAVGGFIGYAAYTTIDGTGMGEIKVTNSTFKCTLDTYVNGGVNDGAVGGFIGIYADGNNLFNGIKITVKDNVFTTVSNTNGQLKRYLGGLIGKYDSADDIVITPESETVTISDNDFQIMASNSYCGGFISYVPKTSGSLKIDTSLYINNVRVYMPADTPNKYIEMTSSGGIASIIESDNLEIKNITISGFAATIGRYTGAVAGRILGEDSVFENLTIENMSFSDYIDGVSLTSNYKNIYDLGAIAGYHKRSAEIHNITVTGLNFTPYISNSINDNLTAGVVEVGLGGLIGALGDNYSNYSVTNISNVSISGVINPSYSGNPRPKAYYGGLIGYVYPKTAVCLDKIINLSGIEKYRSNYNPEYRGKLVGFQREALIYMEPTCAVTYNDELFARIDELGNYGGIYRNETFWDDAVISSDTVSVEGEKRIIEQTPGKESGITVNGSVEVYDGGWGLKTMGDYMRFSIVNNTIGYYGKECFAGAADYEDIAGGTFTALNDMDLSKRYMGVLTLNRNDNCEYNSSYFHYEKYFFHGVFKGVDKDVKITLPSFDVYGQINTGGLFAVVIGAEFRNLIISGDIKSYQEHRAPGGVVGAAALASIVYNEAAVEDVVIDNLEVHTYKSDLNISAGSLFGHWRYFMRSGTDSIEGVDYRYKEGTNNQFTYEWGSSIKNVTVKNSTIYTHGANNGTYIGGLIGRCEYLNYNAPSQTVDFDNVNLTNLDINSECNYGYLGGIVAYTQSMESRKLTLNLNDVKIDGMDITTASNNYTGGFWGYQWNQTDVNLTFTKNTDKVVVDNSNIICTTQYANTRFGGMIYEYNRSLLDLRDGIVIRNTNISAPKSNQNNCSFFVSEASYAIILMRDYRLENTSVEFSGSTFDEIAGNTKRGINEHSQLTNMGIVSISDSEEPFCLKEEGFHVYNYQSDYSKCPNLKKPYYNPYSRYYYNLDEIAAEAAKDPIKLTKITYNEKERSAFDIHSPEQLMIWHLLMTVPVNTSSSSSGYCGYMMRYFSECFDKNDFPSLRTDTLKSYEVKITGTIDMSEMSYYPTAITANRNLGSERFFVGADFDNDNAGKGNNKIIFSYDAINQGTNRCLEEGKNTVALRSNSTVNYYAGASQHSQMHCGLFGADSSINLIDDVSFGGSIGTIEYKYDNNASNKRNGIYSGAAFCGLLQNIDSELHFKNIVLDGLYVVNPKEDYDKGKNEGNLENWKNYCGMLAAGWENNNNICFFNTIETKGYADFISKYPNKKAASALIGRIGYSDLTSFKKFEFANMSIADAEETDVLTANGTTLDGIHATAEDQIMAYASYVYCYLYSQAEQGFYNFDDVCYFYGNGQFTPQSGDKYYITLGKELGSVDGTTKTEYYNTSSKVGTASYDTAKAADNRDYIDFKEGAEDNYWLDFSNLNYKPYIYNYQERNINVNYKSGNLLKGCGTYEDPYIIENERQLYSLYCYLAPGGLRYTNTYDQDVGENVQYSNNAPRYPQYNSGFKTKLNEWKVNIPGTDDHICDGVHTAEDALTYNYEENPVSGFGDTFVTPTSTRRKWDKDSPITVNLLRNAYYKITADIDMSDYDDFYGLCHFDPKIDNNKIASSYFPFTGVIIGEKPNGSAPVIKMPKFKKFAGTYNDMINCMRSYGFVSGAKGCVLKNLDIQYPEDSLARIGYQYSYYGEYIFGGAIGTIWGGDNIIDNVRVSGSVMINHQANSVNSGVTNRNYMGGLVGVVYGGGLILRNLSTDDFSDFDFKYTGLANNVQSTPVPDKSYTQELNKVGADYDYINGVIGRMCDGYALVESVDEPRKAVDKNGVEQKKLDFSGAVIDFSEYDANDPKKLHAQKCYDLINGSYLNDAGKIKIVRSGYNFETEIANEKQLFIYAQTMNSGGFYTACGSQPNSSNYSSSSYGNAMYHSRNNLSHVYHCASSAVSGSYDSYGAYDVYSRCRKAKYDSVGKVTGSNKDDYEYAKQYDNILTKEYFKNEVSEFDNNSYKNYIGYNYMVSKYFDFYEGNKQDQFWIMRRSGLYQNINENQAVKMHNLYNIYSGTDNIVYQGRSNTRLVTGTYDMRAFKQAFWGIGASFNWQYNGNSSASNLQNGSFFGNNSTVILGMDSEAGVANVGLFTRFEPGFGNSSVNSNKEVNPLYEVRDLNITGFAYNNYTEYRTNAQRAGLLCGYINNGRFKISNIRAYDAKLGAYDYAGMIGYIESNTQILIDNCSVSNLEFTNKPELANKCRDNYMGGIAGSMRTSSYGNINSAYITNCSASDLKFTTYSNSRMGGIIGEGNLYYTYIYDVKSENLNFDVRYTDVLCGGFAGTITNGNYVDIKNFKMNNMNVSCPDGRYIYLGGAFGKFDYAVEFSMENTHISKMRINAGNASKGADNKDFSYSTSGWLGGIAGYIYRGALSFDGVYIDDIKMEESKYTESDQRYDANGNLTRAAAKTTQKLMYSGGIVGYIDSYSSNAFLRVASLTEDKITVTPTPSPTPRPQYRDNNISYTRPEKPENPNKGKRNCIKNCEFIAEYAGGVCAYVYNRNTYSADQNRIDWLIDDLDITDNKIVTHFSYKDNNVTASNRYNSSLYMQAAGGMFGYIGNYYNGYMYSHNVNIEHNVIGTITNAPAKSFSGGVYGKIVEGENTQYNYSGYSNYLYNLTLKNNYIGPLDLIKDEEQYFPILSSYYYYAHQMTCDLLKELNNSYNMIRTLNIDELGKYTRLYENGEMVSKDSWDYSVTEQGTGDWYAQDNLYKYARNVGMFIGGNSQTANTNKRFHVFFVAPKIIYDNTLYKYAAEGGVSLSAADAKRPAVDVGSLKALAAQDDLYAYRDYTHIIYDDANIPVEYGKWNDKIADYVVPEGLGYKDNHDYLFAQLRNIYDDYKKQISDGYINSAQYDETAHAYRLKDNYGQIENGYTMDEVYDYVYYGYERDADGNPTSENPDYLSPYKDSDDKVIPMLVYKAQYGTPDMLMNTIINILTNNAGAYNTNVGYFNANTVSILNVESWKMELENGVASPVYESDGVTHAQGGFSVSYEDVLPKPNPTSLNAPKPLARHFKLAHTSYDAQKDDTNGTFTVLHITYGWNPKYITVGGNRLDCSAQMTLDIPVYVSKLLEVQINMKTLDGMQLSENNIALHGSESGTVVLKTTNTVMAEYVYDYPRTMYDSVCLKKKLTFETSPGSIYLHKNTKLTLIDITDHDKVYYYYVDKTIANPQIPFENFVDANGNNYKTRDVSKIEDYPKLGTADNPFTDLRGQRWGGNETDENFINDYGVGVERFIIIVDKSATEIDASDQTAYTYHSIHVRVDDDENTGTDEKLMERIRYDGRDYKNAELNTPTEAYPNPDWYAGEVNGYEAYNYVNIREIDDVKIRLTNGVTANFGSLPAEKIGIGAGNGLKATVDYSLTASATYWNESGKATTDQYLDFVISIQSDNRYVALPIGTKYSFDGSTWYTIGRDKDYEYGKKQIYYYADRVKKDIENGGNGDAYKLIINKLGRNESGTIDVYFDFRDCNETSFSDGNYVVKVDAYKTTKREFPVSGDYQDSWISDVFSVYNSSNIGFALQEDDLLYRGINRYLPKVSDNGVIDFKAQLDFRKYLDEDTGEIKDVVTNQYYTIGFKIMKKRSDGTYVEYSDPDRRFKFYYDRSRVVGEGFGNYDGIVDADDPMTYGYDEVRNADLGGVTYKFTADQLNNGSSIKGVAELAMRLVYNTNDLKAEDFSNYKFVAYLYLSEDTVSGNKLADGSSEVLTTEQVKRIADLTAEPLSDYLIFTLARLKTD